MPALADRASVAGNSALRRAAEPLVLRRDNSMETVWWDRLSPPANEPKPDKSSACKGLLWADLAAL